MGKINYFLVGMCAVCIIFSYIPIYFLWKATPDNSSYLFINPVAPSDTLVYLDAIEQGRAGRWAFENRFNGASAQEWYMTYVPYLFLGKIGKVTGLSSIILFHLAHIGSVVFFVWAIGFCIQTLLPKDIQSVSVLLALFFSGLTSIASVVSHAIAPIRNQAERCSFLCLGSNFWSPESSNVTGLFTSPNILISISAAIVTLNLFFRLFYSNKKNELSLFLFFCIGLFCQPYPAVVILAIIGVWSFIHFRQLSRSSLTTLIVLSIILGGYFWLFRELNPTAFSWQFHVPHISPPIYVFIVGLGSYLLLILFGIDMRLFNEKRYQFILVWIIVQTIVIYAPIPIQRRFAMGQFLPFALLAGICLQQILLKFKNLKFSSFFVFSLLLIGCIDPFLFVYKMSIGISPQHRKYLYIDNDERDVSEWLANFSMPQSVIATDEILGSKLPYLTQRRVWLGHWAQTEDFNQKVELLTDFKKGKLEIHQFSNENNIDYIILSTEISAEKIYSKNAQNVYISD